MAIERLQCHHLANQQQYGHFLHCCLSALAASDGAEPVHLAYEFWFVHLVANCVAVVTASHEVAMHVTASHEVTMHVLAM